MTDLTEKGMSLSQQLTRLLKQESSLFQQLTGLFFVVLSVFLTSVDATAQNIVGSEPTPRKKVAVVLSGGGAKGVAHIGALKVIEQAGIPIDYVVGTSMGAIVGGLYAIGYTPAQMDSMVKAQNWGFILSDQSIRRQQTLTEKEQAERYLLSVSLTGKLAEQVFDGFVKGENLHTLFNDLTAGYHDSIDFRQLPIPFACVAVDLRTAEEVVFHSGYLQEAMRASMAIPAVFTPVRMDSMVLVDGGLLNNFPVDVARRMGADIVIGVDVRSDADSQQNISSLIDVVWRLTDIAEKQKYEENLRDVDIYTQVNVKGYSAASFSEASLDTLTRRGQEAMRRVYDDLLRLKQKIGIAPDYQPAPHGLYHLLTKNDSILIRSISFSGIHADMLRRLYRRIKITDHQHITLTQLHNAMDALYATQLFSHVDYRLQVLPEGGYHLLFIVTQQQADKHLRLGIRYDSETNLTGQLNIAARINRLASTVVLTGKIGKQSYGRLDYHVHMTNLQRFTLSYMYQYNDVNFYEQGRRTYNATFNDHFAEALYSMHPTRNMRFEAGLRYEYYRYGDLLQSHGRDFKLLLAERFFTYRAKLRVDSRDKRSFPTYGTAMNAEFMLVTDNFHSYDGNTPLAIGILDWQSAITVTNRFTILPSLYGRVIWGAHVPFPFLNTIGGDVVGRYATLQVPFEGINFVEQVDNALFVARLKLRQRMGAKHYAFITGNYGVMGESLIDLPDNGRSMLGGSITYGYDSVIGPIEASINYSDWTKDVRFYLNVGFRF
ncbi:MAG: patatin-like phospholipase family protein [Prevotellaceae bacterium]|jgi:NTE family protein|nr:patatin-like phospholipase family protein [Prevotellaceae bacterium]